MRQSRMAGLAVGGMVVLALAIGCGEEPSKPAAVHAVPGAAHGQRVGADSVRGEGAKARFHRVNRLDWVGVAHNAGLVELERRLARREVHGNACDEVLGTMARGTYLPATAHVSPQALRAAAARVLAGSGVCPVSTGAVHPTAFAQSAADLSAQGAALVSGIQAAVEAAPSSGDLAVALLPILDQASQLDPTEADVVMAVASVAQSSTEHWESTLTDAYVATETNGILASYGDCFSYYGTAADGVTGCMGIRRASSLEPVGYRRGAPGGVVFRMAAYEGCPRTSLREVVHMDVAGAIAGAYATAWTGGGALAGALGGGLGASLGEMTWQLGTVAWCYGSAAFRDSQLQKT